jgi:hypothetical protein
MNINLVTNGFAVYRSVLFLRGLMAKLKKS